MSGRHRKAFSNLQSCLTDSTCKGPFTPSESKRKSEKDQRTIGRDQKKSFQTSKKMFTFDFPRCERILMHLPHWTENPLDRDPLDRDPTGQRPHWTENPLDRDPLDRDPTGQRPHWTENPLDRDPLDRDPTGQRPHWTETPLDRDPPGQRPH